PPVRSPPSCSGRASISAPSDTFTSSTSMCRGASRGRQIAMRHLRYTGVCAAGLAVFSAAALGAVADPAAPRSPHKGVLAGDPRLDRKVTVLEQRICVVELLERLGRDTGASIQASDRLGPASGYEVTAVV